ncbi:unnamed protein product [Orchesella dallaii]|uniref:Uncharacterized protein n=1 Tax=Orchesella dallaii TaxID=48710 RepID=A0ABP1PVQ5_9HEXA
MSNLIDSSSTSSEEDFDSSFVRCSLCQDGFVETDKSGLASATNRKEWLAKFCETYGLSFDSFKSTCTLTTFPLCIICKAAGKYVQDLKQQIQVWTDHMDNKKLEIMAKVVGHSGKGLTELAKLIRGELLKVASGNMPGTSSTEVEEYSGGAIASSSAASGSGIRRKNQPKLQPTGAKLTAARQGPGKLAKKPRTGGGTPISIPLAVQGKTGVRASTSAAAKAIEVTRAKPGPPATSKTSAKRGRGRPRKQTKEPEIKKHISYKMTTRAMDEAGAVAGDRGSREAVQPNGSAVMAISVTPSTSKECTRGIVAAVVPKVIRKGTKASTQPPDSVGNGAEPKVSASALPASRRAFRTVSMMSLSTRKIKAALVTVQKKSRIGVTSTKTGTPSKTGGLKMRGQGGGAHSKGAAQRVPLTAPRPPRGDSSRCAHPPATEEQQNFEVGADQLPHLPQNGDDSIGSTQNLDVPELNRVKRVRKIVSKYPYY